MSFNVYPEQTAHLQRVHYRIEIDPAIGATAAEGFIDHLTQRYYGIETAHSSTNQFSLAKERSNMRFERILVNLSENITPVDQVNIDNGGADEDSYGTTFAFTVAYDRPDYIYTHNELFGTTHASAALPILTDPEDAILRQVARTFVYDIIGQREVYNVTTGLEDLTLVTAGQYSTSSDDLETRIEAVEGSITVTAVTTANP